MGFKAFMSNSGIADFPAADDATLLAGMRQAAALGLPVAVHAENDAITAALAARAIAEGRTSARDYLASRPADRRDGGDQPRHPLRRGDRLLTPRRPRQHRAWGGPALPKRAPAASMSPRRPARTTSFSPRRIWSGSVRLPSVRRRCDRDSEVDELWHALRAGDVHVVASDHSPAPADMKSGDDFFAIWGGISGCQSLLTALLSAGHVERGLPLTTLIAVLAERPAQRFGMSTKGRIAPGCAADLALVDLERTVYPSPGPSALPAPAQPLRGDGIHRETAADHPAGRDGGDRRRDGWRAAWAFGDASRSVDCLSSTTADRVMLSPQAKHLVLR